jgi:uncharacterized membrane protein
VRPIARRRGFVARGLAAPVFAHTLVRAARRAPRETPRMDTTITTIEQQPKLVRTLHIIYALHALGLALGAFGAATVVGSFLFGWPSIIAVIVSYIYRGDARGTWLESHFDWAIRTFWWALGLALLIALVSAPLVLLLGLGVVTWMIGLFALGVWAIYRVTRGWLRLNARQAMPA